MLDESVELQRLGLRTYILLLGDEILVLNLFVLVFNLLRLRF